MQMLREADTAARDDTHRTEIERQVELILDVMPETLAAVNVQQVQDLARRVRATITGDVRSAYRDRAGETRSI